VFRARAQGKLVPHISDTLNWSTGVSGVRGFSPRRDDSFLLLSPKNKQLYFCRPIFPFLITRLSFSTFFFFSLFHRTSLSALNRSMHTPRPLSQSLYSSRLKSDRYRYPSTLFSLVLILNRVLYFFASSLICDF
jgi:hypothetical protein